MRPDAHEHILTGHTVGVEQSPGLVPRKARDLIAEALSDTRVVTLNGARQAGKSTLARCARLPRRRPQFSSGKPSH